MQNTPIADPGKIGPGKAYLVGAGPGRADLITLRGWQLLQQADVVLYDRLVAPELLDAAKPTATLIYVGKTPGRHEQTQEAINALLVEHVQAGQQVVRLKGGDPFVFGRGGEEALALHAAGLPFEIVPGVSAALAAPAYAGIPVTHRGISTAFAVVTGHERSDRKNEQGAVDEENFTDWGALALIPTLVVLMGVSQIAQIAQKLIAAGRAPSTPAAAIRWGSTDDQQVVLATLGDIAQAIALAHLQPPAVIVIGETVALHEQLAWFQPETTRVFWSMANAKISKTVDQ